MPTASIVVKIGEGKKVDVADKGSLAERAASNKKKSTGSHSMHSIGLYAQDDGNKANTFESGGVLYEHVLSDDEDEDENEEGDGNALDENEEGDGNAEDEDENEGEEAAEEEDVDSEDDSEYDGDDE